MKKSKKILSAVLCLVMAFSLFVIAPATVGAETSGDYQYKILDDNSAEITGYNGSATELTIPSKLGSHIVTSIVGAFANCKSIEKVTIPNSVKRIGDETFKDCRSLIKVEIPSSVTWLGSQSFEDCRSLLEVTLPDSITYLGYNIFENCRSLESVTLPKETETITSDMFYNCMSLDRITIPSSVKYINGGAFQGCTGLREISNMSGVKYIGNYAFQYCTSLSSIPLPNTVVDITNWAFEYCDNLKDVYYSGTKVDWSKVNVFPIGNKPLENSKIHCKDGIFGTEITLKNSKGTIYVTGKTTIKATVSFGKGATTYKSSNTKVAKVNDKGVVTGVKAGTAKITVANNGVKKTFTATVKNPTLNKKSVTLKKNEKFTLKVTGGVGKAVFNTSSKKIATVSTGGKIVGKKKGNATVTVKTNGITLKCKVKVK